VLKITDIQELREKVAHKEEIRESTLSADLTSFCYMISAENTFDNPWARECRGIVFDSAGKVCSRPLHKFFNVNEREETRAENLDWANVVRVMDKRDGSMIHPVKMSDGSIRLKSKKSFDSDVAKAATSWVIREFEAGRKGVNDILSKLVLDIDCTPIFEWTAPDARIVLPYEQPELRLLHIRDNEDGNYWSLSALVRIAEEYNIKMVDEVDEFWWKMGGEGLPATREFNIDKMLEAAKTREGIEGWVIQFSNGEMVKLKTDWYMKRHKAMTFLRERDIADLVLTEGIDDLKALLIGDGVNIQQILDIEARVIEDIRNIERNTKAVCTQHDFMLDRKTFVQKFREKAGPYFGLLMNLYSGKTADYRYFFEKNMLKQNYGLGQLTLIPSVAEGE